MTIREMIKKINVYNEIAESIGKEKVDLGFRMRFTFEDCLGIQEDYRAFKKYLNKYHIPELVDAILKCDKWQFNEELELPWKDDWSDGTELITFYTTDFTESKEGDI